MLLVLDSGQEFLVLGYRFVVLDQHWLGWLNAKVLM